MEWRYRRMVYSYDWSKTMTHTVAFTVCPGYGGTTEKARTENAAPKCRGGKGEKMYIY